VEPRIETTEIKLVGVQGIVRVNRRFVPDLEKLYRRLVDRLESIPDISAANRTFGYWHFVDNETRLYFAGIQVDSLDRFKWDHAYGLVAWSLGNTTWAIWPEPDGQEGPIVHGGVRWRWLDDSGYRFDDRFVGDFEAYEWQEGQIGKQTRSDVHQIWIPVVRQEHEP
jgi:hypothetical protein